MPIHHTMPICIANLRYLLCHIAPNHQNVPIRRTMPICHIAPIRALRQSAALRQSVAPSQSASAKPIHHCCPIYFSLFSVYHTNFFSKCQTIFEKTGK
jgi:hypothetical protein